MNINIFLTCPIRGILRVRKYDDKGNYAEEYQRIELIKFLLEKGYSSEEILINHEVKWGSSKKDKLIADIFVNSPPYIVCEVKKNSKNKKDAIETQLKPALKLKNALFGIYFDGSSNELHYKESVYSINKLPKKGYSWNQVGLKFDDLRKINEVNSLYQELNQIMYNYGVSLEKRHKGLLQILIAKYFDEKFNKEELSFQIVSSNHSKELERLNKLYKKAKSFYYTGIRSTELEEVLSLDESTVISLVRYLQEYSFIKSDISAIQVFFMKFGKELLKIDLSQYYTPLPIVKFISSILDIKPNQLVIDPAGGSADFLVGILEKYKKSEYLDDYSKNLYYWDISPDAFNVARINMILHGDGKGGMSELDSIENYAKMNGEFDFVITNPPFGNRTFWNKDEKLLEKNTQKVYALSQNTYWLGVLFIERSINLLKEGGVLVIILPSGYLNNQTLKYIREYLFKYRIIADISLPEGAFKGANTGVKTDILMVKKITPPENYKIFVSAPKKLGFNYHSKNLEMVYKIDEKTGEYLQNEHNENILDDEINEIVSQEFQKFCCDENLEGFEQCKLEKKCVSKSESYDYVSLVEIKKDEYYKIKPELFLNSFRKHVNKLILKKSVSLREIFEGGESILVDNSKSIEVKNDSEYWYIDISNSSRGDYLLENLKKGWEIKKIDRAKQSAERYDIFLSYLLGSKDKFFMILEDKTDNIVVTNGLYKVRINNEKIRLSFLAFLFSKSFEIQFEAFATGHIQTNIVLERVWDFKFPLLNNEGVENWKNYLIQVEKTKKEFGKLIKLPNSVI